MSRIEQDLRRIVGARIEAGFDVDGWPVIVVRTPSGERLQLEISRDAEGNGPGHVFVSDYTPDDES